MTDWPGERAPSEAWTHLATQVLGSPASSITFSGISAAAGVRLRLYLYFIKDGTAGGIDWTLNNDTTATNYDWQRLEADGVTVASARVNGTPKLQQDTPQNTPALAVLEISKPVAGKVARAVTTTATEDSTPQIGLDIFAVEWGNTAAVINRVDLTAQAGNLDTGTRAVLEGAA